MATNLGTGTGAANTEVIRELLLTQIEVSETNQRRTFNDINEMAASIKEKGVLEPLLVRRIEAAEGGEERFKIIAGERRYRGAKKARLETVPCRVLAVSDEEALEVQIIENLQRAELHPLEEAEGFKYMREVLQLDEKTIAQRVAKTEKYITHRLALTDLIKEAKTDFQKNLITLAHALEICVLEPEVQKVALAACYEQNQTWDQTAGSWVYTPDKERPVRNVRFLQSWLQNNVHMNLKNAPFKTDDTRLRKDGLTCLECPSRTGSNAVLFADIHETDTCLNRACFQAKVTTLVQITKEGLDAKRDTPAAFVTTNYSTKLENVLTRYHYEEIERRGVKCEFAEKAVMAEGSRIGRVVTICREPTCKDHLGKAGAPSSNNSSSGESGESGKLNLLTVRERKQELFDMRVDEAVRLRVFGEAVKTYTYPLDREQMNTVASQFFRRITSEDQRTILTVLEWPEDKINSLRYNESKMLAEIEKMEDDQLAQFMMLCTFAHFGANQYMNKKQDQSPVEKLSKARGVNIKLIDAEVRLERAPKKHKAAHETYLEKVRAGSKNPKKPLIYEVPPKVSASADAATGEGGELDKAA
jgi:ParB family chromosome partitioning protein